MANRDLQNTEGTGPVAARPMMVAAMAPYEHRSSVFIPNRILRLPEVMARVGLCRASIYQYMMAGMFPKQITLGPRAVGWLEHEIDAWLMARIQARTLSKKV